MRTPAKRRKTRGDAFETKLSPEQLQQLYVWGARGWKVAVANAKQEWNFKIGKTAFLRWFHKDDDLKVLSFIANGSQMTRKIDDAYRANPEPQLETLVKLCKTLVMQLSIQGATDLDALEAANSLFRTVLEFLKIQEKREDRKLSREQFEVKTCELFLKWHKDKRLAEIADSQASNADKIASMRQVAFSDIDALEQSGDVEIPK